MVTIGNKPILWHIMKIYSSHGINDFIICLGYKGFSIKEYFANYFLYTSDVTFDVQKNAMHVHQNKTEPWKVTLVETGECTMTGGRIKRVRDHIDDTFLMTYGDVVGNVDIASSIQFHKQHKRLATVTISQPPGRFGAINISESNEITRFQEKPRGDGGWVNAGFFVLEPKIFEYIEDDSTVWEKAPLLSFTKEKQLSGFKHNGFWHPMDTLSDKSYLENLWETQKAPWKIWNN